jgi:hypothetical protein
VRGGRKPAATEPEQPRGLLSSLLEKGGIKNVTPLMHTHNETLVHAPLETCLEAASDVERWPSILPHYRQVRFSRQDGPGCGRVRMEAYRHFGPLPYPIWWESDMVTDFEAAEVRYRHIAGITTGMDVVWKLEPRADGTHIVILHDWSGPEWPVVGGFAARAVIGPRFIHVVAARTLSGIKRAAEASRNTPGDNT